MSEERKKIVGVNLGNWLVLEKWMQPFCSRKTARRTRSG